MLLSITKHREVNLIKQIILNKLLSFSELNIWFFKQSYPNKYFHLLCVTMGKTQELDVN